VAGKLRWDRLKKRQYTRRGSAVEDNKPGALSERAGRLDNTVRRGNRTSASPAVLEYIRSLARSDLLKSPTPKVPKVVLDQLQLAAAHDVAIAWLRRRDEYKSAFSLDWRSTFLEMKRAQSPARRQGPNADVRQTPAQALPVTEVLSVHALKEERHVQSFFQALNPGATALGLLLVALFGSGRIEPKNQPR